jgi:sec-independent protein translocase protein TatC
VKGIIRRRGSSQFQRAADGSMTLMEHLRELRMRLFRASLAILVGFFVGYWLSDRLIEFVKQPVCHVLTARGEPCEFQVLGAADFFILELRVGLWVGLVLAAPIWLYQLWAFIAPGLHRHERRWAYAFAAVAAPLFASGAFAAYFALQHGLEFLLPKPGIVTTQLEITRYVDFITNVMLIFGVAFEFPLVVMLLNFTGMVSAKRLLGWWRTAIFLFFAFAAVVTPTPDPFTMSGLAGAMSLLYFGAVGVAFLNDRRRRRNEPDYSKFDDDELSPLQHDAQPVETSEPVDTWEPIDRPTQVSTPLPLDRRYDDST